MGSHFYEYEEENPKRKKLNWSEQISRLATIALVFSLLPALFLISIPVMNNLEGIPARIFGIITFPLYLVFFASFNGAILLLLGIMLGIIAHYKRSQRPLTSSKGRRRANAAITISIISLLFYGLLVLSFI